ncbi:ornithine cyclodeaminase family protein [Myxococcus sp. K15C18031901]|uniref:ornithine cyclodeaminase family protein n=1 Tax=Myxococcus dinghuensis TaxID=2906761 RepID=UPI0020A6E6EE|nr:ornithine cyclodeaminase family protein [Myxococcus dinghuensis]MCP3103008.1 ornithine cyclodeaminase family protein [Myxococcus dinghuensis]
MPTLILTARDMRGLYTVDLGLEAVERAFRAHGRGESLMPPKVYLSLPKYDGDFRAMPAYLDGAAGVKWVNAHPQNPKKHQLPTVRALYILSDPDTASPLAILDGTLLTAWRTGCAGGVASRFLARPQPRTLGLVGCGVQARVLIDAHRAIYGELELLLADTSEAAAKALQAEKGGRVVSLQEASGADIVCTSTPSRTPVVKREWLTAGAHINAMGADAPGKQELDARILTEGRVFIDDTEQAHHSGEVNVPLHDGLLRADQIAGTLGEVVAGLQPGRTGNEVTVFDSTGLAVQDLALARALYDRARAQSVGQTLDIVGG